MRIPACLALLTLLNATAGFCQDVFSFDVATHRKVYRESAQNEIYVQARLSPSPALDSAHPASPQNIALVLDRSGSMAGDRIDALRSATISATAALTARDSLSILTFGSEIETLVEGQRGDHLQDLPALLDRIEAVGGAALYEALNQAAAILRRHSAADSVNRLIVVTDGLPTKGPRAQEDFAKLAEAFAGEGIVLTAIGVGDEFDEDLLAVMARNTGGRFRFAAQPAELDRELDAELARQPVLLGRDAELSFIFRRTTQSAEAHGWLRATASANNITYRFSRLIADPTLTLLASAELDPAAARVYLPEIVSVRLRWTDVRSGETHELTRTLAGHFTNDSRDFRRGADPDVTRTAASLLIAEALQEAIDELDDNDPRQAARVLRNARSEVRDMNFDVDDPAIAELLRDFDAYLDARNLEQADRKSLRAGVSGRFPLPWKSDKPKR